MNIEMYRQPVPNFTLNEIICSDKWNLMFSGSIVGENEMDQFHALRSTNCFLFTGVAGSGKRTLMKAFAATACENDWYAYYLIPITEVMGYAADRMCDNIDACFGELLAALRSGETSKQLFISFGDINDLAEQPAAGRCFLRNLGKLRQWDGGHCIVTACYDGDASELSQQFRSIMKICPMQCVEVTLREEFFDAYLGDLLTDEKVLSVADLVTVTEDCTFGELRQLYENILMLAKAKTLRNYERTELAENRTCLSDFDVTYEEITALVEDIRSSRPVPVQEMPPMMGVPYMFPADAEGSQMNQDVSSEALKNLENYTPSMAAMEKMDKAYNVNDAITQVLPDPN